jgi:hypothetical protein
VTLSPRRSRAAAPRWQRTDAVPETGAGEDVIAALALNGEQGAQHRTFAERAIEHAAKDISPNRERAFPAHAQAGGSAG